MELENIIDEFLNAYAHIYLENGAYVNKNYDLVFDRKEHNKLFGHGYYLPHYKDWLLENAEIRIK
jgi:hypothetical protein